MIATETAPPSTGIAPRPWRWNVEEYYKLGEQGFFKGKRVELIRGEIVEMSPLGWPHSLASGLVVDVLSRVFAPGSWVNEQKPFSVPGSARGSEPQPDVAVIPGSRRDYTSHPSVAELIVEVADSTLFYDSTTKAELYASAGVPEYWVLDLVGRRLLVFRDPESLPSVLGASTYRTHFSLAASEAVVPLAAPGQSIAVSELLP